ncbi:MAG: hypothetical protein AAF989_17565, partial [Planctomycetota bacterium]
WFLQAAVKSVEPLDALPYVLRSSVRSGRDTKTSQVLALGPVEVRRFEITPRLVIPGESSPGTGGASVGRATEREASQGERKDAKAK